ncbi:hypothetical protein [Salinimonas lutimaris]|uniref:hypothetical protein n=1 Tax=Salinimonas lutimaris TaxID=914153 RepID=UPI0010C056B3|nr:hypothetical protein [Salinimonas lutimaris]
MSTGKSIEIAVSEQDLACGKPFDIQENTAGGTDGVSETGWMYPHWRRARASPIACWVVQAAPQCNAIGQPELQAGR